MKLKTTVALVLPAVACATQGQSALSLREEATDAVFEGCAGFVEDGG
jgi:hypothetical protein